MRKQSFWGILLGLLSMVALGACTGNAGTCEKTAVNHQSSLKKSVQPWYCVHEGTSFEELAPFVDQLTCINVFGEVSREFIDQCHAHGIELYHSVGGGVEKVDTPEKRTIRIKEFVDYCVKNNYDGLDIDYEHLPDSIRDTYSEWLRECSEALHAAGKKISHCVPFTSFMFDDENTPLFCDPAVLNETMDYVRVMCYDMYYAPGIQDPLLEDRIDCNGIAPTTTFHWAERVIQYWSERIDIDKLVMALPAYGNDYILTGNEVKGAQLWSSRGPQNVKGELPEPIWQYYEKLNMYVYDDMNGERHLYYASDAASTRELLKLVDRFGIRTIGFWHFSSISDEMWEEVNAWMKK